MNVSFQQANPRAGAESYLLRFEETGRRTACVLVDAGKEVDLDDLLSPNDYLAAVLLTHTHSDHYQSIEAVLRDGAPIYTSSATGSILETVLDGANQGTLSVDTERVVGAVEPIDNWTRVIEGLRICPIPAGHAPGATGFAIEFGGGTENDGESVDGDGNAGETDEESNGYGDRHHVIVTGDFTERSVAGYPGFATDLPLDVEAVFLTTSTCSDFEAELTEAIGTIVKRAHAGSSVLVTASGLTSVHCAYLLANLPSEFNPPPVTLAGQAAKLYEALDYQLEGVKTAPTFDDPSELLAPETVTIAGPEVPTLDRTGNRMIGRGNGTSANSLPHTSAGQLFGTIRSDPSATLVQLVGGGHQPIKTADCTVASYSHINHPTGKTVESVVDAFDPTEVVIQHQIGEAAKRYRDTLPCLVWAVDGTDIYDIYDGEWLAPPWMTETGRRLARNGANDFWLTPINGGGESERSIPLSNLSRVDDPDLAAEGLDMDQLADRLRVRDPPSQASETPSTAGSAVATDSSPMSSTSLVDTPPADGQRSGAEGETNSSETGKESVEAMMRVRSKPLSDEDSDEMVVVGDAVIKQLDRIEAKLDRGVAMTVPARVIDVGDGITLLRVRGDLDLCPGETVSVSISIHSESKSTDENE